MKFQFILIALLLAGIILSGCVKSYDLNKSKIDDGLSDLEEATDLTNENLSTDLDSVFSNESNNNPETITDLGDLDASLEELSDLDESISDDNSLAIFDN